jgi:general secretion pathway protein G
MPTNSYYDLDSAHVLPALLSKMHQAKSSGAQVEIWSGGSPRRMMRRRGFTLIELMVVMVILGLLVAHVAPRYFAQVSKSERKVTQAQLESFAKALDQYRLDTGHYPKTEQGLGALVARPAEESKWDGPYLQKTPPADPWGRPYVYRSPGEKSEYELLSLGRDGAPGGSGEDADIAL